MVCNGLLWTGVPEIQVFAGLRQLKIELEQLRR